MKRSVKISLIVAAVVIGTAAVIWLFFVLQPGAWDSFVDEMNASSSQVDQPRPATKRVKNSKGLVASGTIESKQATLSAEAGGKVTEILAAEGDTVEAGQELLKLDSAIAEIQLITAQAGLDNAKALEKAANAQLEMAKPGARTREIEMAQEQLALAESSVLGAEAAVDGAEAAVDLAKAQYQAAVGQRNAAEAAVSIAEIELTYAEWARRGVDMAEQGVSVAEGNLQSAQAGVDAAQAGLETADAQLKAAEAGVAAAIAQRNLAQISLQLLENGAQGEEKSLLEANMEQAKAGVSAAEAAVAAAELQVERQTIVAPFGGMLVEQLFEVGELSGSGAPLVILADLSQVTIKVYVPETQLDKVHIGQSVEVTVDSYDKVFDGKVTKIASRAEFTPSNVQTQEERVNLVFAVEVQVENELLELKPGMPADARFIP